MKQILQTVAGQLTEFLQIEHIAIHRLDESKPQLVLEYCSGFSEESTRRLGELKSDDGILNRLIETRIPQVVNDIPQTEEGFSFLAQNEELASMIALPLFSAGKVWGVLTAYSREPFRFGQEDARAINLFVGELAELTDIFSRRLRDNLDELLVRLLGSLELMNFKFQKRTHIPVSEIQAEQSRMRDRVLSLLTDAEMRFISRPAGQDRQAEAKIVLPSGDELNVEEVVNIQGEKNASPGTKKVLVIDDQPIVTDLLVSVLERMAYHSEVASSGTEGLEMFKKDGFDLVITDLGMPDVSGWEVSKAVKERKPNVPVVVITGWGVDPDPNKLKESRVDLIIHKPFQIDELEKIIRGFLEK